MPEWTHIPGFVVSPFVQPCTCTEHFGPGVDTLNGDGCIGGNDWVGFNGDADVSIIVGVTEIVGVTGADATKNVVPTVGIGAFNGGEDVGLTATSRRNSVLRQSQSMRQAWCL